MYVLNQKGFYLYIVCADCFKRYSIDYSNSGSNKTWITNNIFAGKTWFSCEIFKLYKFCRMSDEMDENGNLLLELINILRGDLIEVGLMFLLLDIFKDITNIRYMVIILSVGKKSLIGVSIMWIIVYFLAIGKQYL